MKKENNENGIRVCFDRESDCIWNGVEYYNTPCITRICVNEKVLNRDQVQAIWNNETINENSIDRQMANQWKENWWIYDNKTGTYEKEYHADQDGKYHCSVEYTNGNGETISLKSFSFVVDQTKPEILVEKIGREEGKESEFLLEVKDGNFSRAKTRVYIREWINGKETWNPVEVFWVQVGDTALSQLQLSWENLLGFIIQSEDLAGNKAEYYKEIKNMKKNETDTLEYLSVSMITLLFFFLLTVFTGLRKIFP